MDDASPCRTVEVRLTHCFCTYFYIKSSFLFGVTVPDMAQHVDFESTLMVEIL